LKIFLGIFSPFFLQKIKKHKKFEQWPNLETLVFFWKFHLWFSNKKNQISSKIISSNFQLLFHPSQNHSLFASKILKLPFSNKSQTLEISSKSFHESIWNQGEIYSSIEYGLWKSFISAYFNFQKKIIRSKKIIKKVRLFEQGFSFLL